MAASCCIPHMRGNIPAVLHHEEVNSRRCSGYADLTFEVRKYQSGWFAQIQVTVPWKSQLSNQGLWYQGMKELLQSKPTSKVHLKGDCLPFLPLWKLHDPRHRNKVALVEVSMPFLTPGWQLISCCYYSQGGKRRDVTRTSNKIQ